jgi:hypothetical protein
MRAKMNDAYVGTWCITEMELWDEDFINLVTPGNIIIEKDGRGSFSFGAVEVGLDCATEEADGKSRIDFSFAGYDEGTEVSGRGWMKLHGNELKGEIHFYLGDKSWFKARKEE